MNRLQHTNWNGRTCCAHVVIRPFTLHLCTKYVPFTQIRVLKSIYTTLRDAGVPGQHQIHVSLSCNLMPSRQDVDIKSVPHHVQSKCAVSFMQWIIIIIMVSIVRNEKLWLKIIDNLDYTWSLTNTNSVYNCFVG